MMPRTRELETAAVVFAAAALVCAPAQWSLWLLPGFRVGPADLLLALAAGVWLAALACQRAWGRLRLPPWPHVLFLLLAAASTAVAHDRRAALRETIQIGLYFAAGSCLAADWLRNRAAAGRWLVAILLGTTGPILAATAIQYFSAGSDPLSVRGVFSDRHLLGGHLALMMPLAFGLMMTVSSWTLRIGLGLLVLAGLAFNLDGASFYAVAVVIMFLSILRGWRAFVVAGLALVLWQSSVLPRLPRENDLALFRSVALYRPDGKPERRYPEWQAAANLILERPWLGAGAGNYQRSIGPYFDTLPNETGPSEPGIQNLYLVIAASMGLPALLAFLALLALPVSIAVRTTDATPGWRRGAAAGAAGGLAAFAVTAAWHPLLVRELGPTLVAVLALAGNLGGRPAAQLPPTS